MDTILIENVRCFRGRHAIPIVPLTLLVGENSSGKTTFLAVTRIAWEAVQFWDAYSFNSAPFFLGAFDEVASVRRGSGGRAESFAIGFGTTVSLDGEVARARAEVLARFRKQKGQPAVHRWSLECGRYKIVADSQSEGRVSLKLRCPSGRAAVLSERLARGSPLPWFHSGYFQFALRDNRLVRPRGSSNGAMPTETDLKDLERLLFAVWHSRGPYPLAAAPIRTEPYRTYEPITDFHRPAGSHVPMYLAAIYRDELWQTLQTRLVKFGRASGLFQSIEIKRLGRDEGDPFQILVKSKGSMFNLIDVGYGVSQALPIVVDAINTEKGSCLLFQQPEVHLHPKAQAALGSLLGALTRTDQKRFLVETHSDYLVDRIRRDVREQGSPAPDQAMILYFEQTKAGAQIYPIALDDQGNLVDPPPTYRRFFLEEERRFLGV